MICFDTKNDSGKFPLADDYCFYIAARGNKIRSGIMQGNGNGWTVIQDSRLLDRFGRMGYSYTNDPYGSRNGHVVSEFRIPMAYGLEEQMGFYVYANDSYHNKFVEWPEDAGGKQFGIKSATIRDVLAAPYVWGKLKA